MVFVTVGTGLEPMMRLLVAVDRLAGEGVLGEPLVQAGHYPDFRPRHCRAVRFLPLEQMQERIAEAELIICHAGAGTAILVLGAGKVPVMMPRRKRYGEVIDDHQLELTRALGQAGRVVPAYEADELGEAIAQARQHSATRPAAEPPRMMRLVEQALRELGEP